MTAAVAAATLTAVAVIPDAGYLGYFDWRTLVCLFCAMAVVQALDNSGFIGDVGRHAVGRFRTWRGLTFGLVGLTGAAAMFVSNDVALLTFLPLTFAVLQSTGDTSRLPFMLVMETAAANLGGMLLPFGSPQNLFLFSWFEIPAGEFITVIAIPFTVSMALIGLICLRVPNDPIELTAGGSSPVRIQRETIVYLALFTVTVAVVFRVLPLWAGVLIPACLLAFDRSALRKVDWGLLFTFIAFFVFAGNITRIPSVSETIAAGLEGNVLLWSAAGSQVISNVPAAVLLAHFTDSYRELLVGVNIGGVGTPVASLANLIALAKQREYQPESTRAFLRIFVLVNGGLLVALYMVAAAVLEAGIL